MRISEPIDMSGYFWLPGKPDQRLPGELHVSKSGKTTLELIGVFGDDITAIDSSSPCLHRVVGVVENGDLVTLEHCVCVNINISSGGISKSTINAELLLVGVQYEESESIVFSKITFSIEGLDEWLSVSGIRVEHNEEEKTASIHFNPPKEIVCQLTDDMNLAFTFAWSYPFAPDISEAKITQQAFITIKSETLRPITDYMDMMFKLTNFLCFAIDETVSLVSVTCSAYDITLDCGDGKKYEVPIKLYYQSIPNSDTHPKIVSHNMLLQYGRVSSQIELILKNWLNNYETSEPAFNLYFASKSGAHNYLEVRFLSLAQGIETLHRRNSEETIMPEDEYNELVSALVKSCSPNKQEWLKNKMEYSNELTLRRRIKEMLKPFESLFGDSNQRKQFIGKVTDTRNYYTHYDKKLSKQAAKGETLWKLCMKLEALFQLHLLRLIELDEQYIKNMIANNRSLRRKLET